MGMGICGMTYDTYTYIYTYISQPNRQLPHQCGAQSGLPQMIISPVEWTVHIKLHYIAKFVCSVMICLVDWKVESRTNFAYCLLLWSVCPCSTSSQKTLEVSIISTSNVLLFFTVDGDVAYNINLHKVLTTCSGVGYTVLYNESCNRQFLVLAYKSMCTYDTYTCW